jgi:hypothetical protein
MKQVECSKCNSIVDIDGCRVREEEVESARAGGSWSLGGSLSRSIFGTTNPGKGRRKSGGIRYNTGRQYYKKVKVYTCPDCAGWGDGNIVKVKTNRNSNASLMEAFDVSDSAPVKAEEPLTKESLIFLSVFSVVLLIGLGWAFWYHVGLGCFVLFLYFWLFGKMATAK